MTFSPARIAISSITQANPCVVTTVSNHNLTTGQVVRLHVPKNYGMVQLNQKQVHAKVINAISFSIWESLIPNTETPIISTNFTSFTTPSNPQFTAEIIPIGSGPTPLTSTIVQQRNNSCDDPIADATVNYSTTEIPF